MNFGIGKYYRTEGGSKVLITGTDQPGKYSVRGLVLIGDDQFPEMWDGDGNALDPSEWSDYPGAGNLKLVGPWEEHAPHS